MSSVVVRIFVYLPDDTCGEVPSYLFACSVGPGNEASHSPRWVLGALHTYARQLPQVADKSVTMGEVIETIPNSFLARYGIRKLPEPQYQIVVGHDDRA